MLTNCESPFKCIYSEESELKLKHSGTQETFSDLDIKIEDGYLFISPLKKETNFHFSSSTCRTLKAIFHQPCSMALYFHNFFV